MDTKKFWEQVREDYKAATEDDYYICDHSPEFHELWRKSDIYELRKDARNFLESKAISDGYWVGIRIFFNSCTDFPSVTMLQIRQQFIEYMCEKYKNE